MFRVSGAERCAVGVSKPSCHSAYRPISVSQITINRSDIQSRRFHSSEFGNTSKIGVGPIGMRIMVDNVFLTSGIEETLYSIMKFQ